MTEASRHWVSGNWHVADGKADEFIERWTEFLGWTKDANDGFLFARLIHDMNDPGHFVSFASWQDAGSIRAWQEKPEFAERFGSCRALCTDASGGSYELARAI